MHLFIIIFENFFIYSVIYSFFFQGGNIVTHSGFHLLFLAYLAYFISLRTQLNATAMESTVKRKEFDNFAENI